MHAYAAYIAYMAKVRIKSQYTIRDIPVTVDNRLRETAALEDISLNQAALRALQRGLGTAEEPIRYRSVRDLLPQGNSMDITGWTKILKELDHVDPADWK